MKCKTILTASIGFAAFLLGPSLALAASAPALGSAEGFAALAGKAVTCTTSIVTGDVGVATVNGFTNTGCTISGTVYDGGAAAAAAYADFLAAYAQLATEPCTRTIDGNLAGQVLAPGVYCVAAASTTTDGVLTLKGPSNGIWIFKIGTGGTGALTGTHLSVVMAGGADSCNVYWWVAQAATLTDSTFLGTILAGADITITRGTFSGDAMAGGAGFLSGEAGPQPTGAVTMTDTKAAACVGGNGNGNGGHHCNQGVGNGPENCDPGNSNQGDPGNSNDELGGTPGHPGKGK